MTDGATTTLTPFESDEASAPPRAARHLRLPSFVFLDPEIDPDRALGGLRVAVVGCGAVGRCFATALARLDVGRIDLVDHGQYKLESLNTQAIGPDEIGRAKASSTAERLAAIHPGTGIRVHDGPVQDLRDDAFSDCDLVFLATDNLRAEIEVNRRCRLHRVPLLQGAVYGDMLIAQVRFLVNQDPGPCLVCGFGDAEFRAASDEVSYSCDGSPRGGGDPAATMSVAGLSSLAADLAMMVLLRHVLRLGAPVADVMLEFCGYTFALTTSPLHRNQECPADHLPSVRRELPVDLASRTPRALAEAAGLDLDRAGGAVSFTVDEYHFAPRWQCRCPEGGAINRFVRSDQRIGTCQECWGTLEIDRFAWLRRVPLDAIGTLLDRTLRDLGASTVRYVVVRSNERAVIVTGRRPDDTPGNGSTGPT